MPAAKADHELFALVIGTNVSPDEDVKPLRYADDDAAQNAQLLLEIGATVILATSLDAESLLLHPTIDRSPPTRSTVDRALSHLNRLMKAARAQGKKTSFYFFYSGHGNVEHNQGYVALEDGRLRRDDLVALLKDSQADENHLIIDACKSYFLVFDRGAAAHRSPVAGRLIPTTHSLPANAGVLLSSSTATDSHEWQAFHGGIFSHEVRSALRGAADQDLDGRVTYEEVGAFVWAANAAIPNPRYRPDPYIRSPGGQAEDEAVLLDIDRSTADRLEVSEGFSDHYYVEDEHGLRVADFHPSEHQTLIMRVPSRRPMYVRNADSDREVELPPEGRLALASLPTRSGGVLSRGAEHLAFRKLFREPFGPTTLSAYRQKTPFGEAHEVPTPTPEWRHWVRNAFALGGVGFTLVGGAFTGLAMREKNTVRPESSGLRAQTARSRIHSYNRAAAASYALGVLAVVGYGVRTLLDRDDVELQILTPDHVQLGLLTRF